jgi:Domain of unknown function (DUF1922)
MAYEVRCECGRALTVEETSAGAALPCDCGRTVQVPRLSELKRQAGQAAFRPRATLVIEHMLAAGELPPANCACCGVATDDILHATTLCERARKAKDSRSLLPLYLLFGLVGLLIWAGRPEPQVAGDNLFVRTPLRLCPNCRRMFLPRRRVPNLSWLKVGLLVVGLPLLLVGSVWGLVLLGADALLILTETALRRRQQAERKRILCQVPVYGQLFDEFPQAEVALGSD